MRHALIVVLLVAGVGLSSCRLLSREVACSRDGDCPRDVGLGFCDVPEDADGGVGVCVEVDPSPPQDDDDAGPGFVIPDGGLSDAG